MKKLVLINLLIISFIELSLSQYNKIPEQLLKGRIKKITETTYKPLTKAGTIVKGGEVLTTKISFYNRNGKDSITLNYDKILPPHKWLYTYSANGQLIEINDYLGNQYSGKTVFKYNEKGNEIEKHIYSSNGSLSKKILFKYDNNYKIIEEGHENNGYDTIREQSFKYDNRGNQIEEIDYSPDGSIDFKIIKIYDESNNKIEEDYYHINDSTVYYKDIFTYDENANVVEWITYEMDGRINKTTYKYLYDDTGN